MRSPLQNRVTPTGKIVAHIARGTLMGNRGILHNADRQLGTARWKHQAWVTCTLSYKNVRRTLMRPNWYTELFFTDEAVALAAGHRPCAQCRRDDFNRFQAAFSAGQGKGDQKIPAPEMDKLLHKARVNSRSRAQVTHRAEFASLPEEAFFKATASGPPLLVRGGQIWAWSFDGYSLQDRNMPDEVEVLTPKPTVDALRSGYRLFDNPARGA